MIADLSAPRRHSRLEDFQGIFIAAVQAALGIHLLRAAGLLTGGSAGVALLLSYLYGWNFSLVFFLWNLPFFGFAYYARGPIFCLKSILTVVIVSALAELLKPILILQDLHPGAAAFLFGISTGVGLLGLFRHSGSLGGVSILALILQDRTGLKASTTQMIHDGALFILFALIFPLQTVAWSVVGAVILNVVIYFNHRRDLYVAR